MASEMSIIMPGWRAAHSSRAISRKGKPPYRKMATERTGATHAWPGKAGGANPNSS